MKRWVAVLVLLFVVAGLCACAPSNAVRPSRLSRETVLPLQTVQDLTGCTLKLAYDRRDDRRGLVVWAWEETRGEPRLLYVELYMPPADIDTVFDNAEQRAQVLSAPRGMRACDDGRSVYLNFDGYTVRIVAMGTLDKKGALTALQQALQGNLPALPVAQETAAAQ